eukprot:CAMPEP_0177649476 /NCGR_PEP_ID=MMETSP0447-20121125/11415_1 /TAXON_ID=0 /ORGANISM="Stygamoeba regulata, Strain BSH-02190019" /LENGTH=125 /DNA_ID=CAMNT_0019152253 /DNA_START=199 /DNA_END=576 /DNA_ORIENTATION=+
MADIMAKVKQLENEVKALRKLQAEINGHLTQKQQLTTNLNENKMVIGEIDLLESDATVFKMVGPILARETVDEAKENVKKRMDFINAELKRIDEAIATKEKTHEAQKERVMALQAALQKMGPRAG